VLAGVQGTAHGPAVAGFEGSTHDIRIVCRDGRHQTECPVEWSGWLGSWRDTGLLGPDRSGKEQRRRGCFGPGHQERHWSRIFALVLLPR